MLPLQCDVFFRKTHGRDSSWAPSLGKAELCLSAYNWHSLKIAFPYYGQFALCKCVFFLVFVLVIGKPRVTF
jgi:hypothetical protein